MSEISITEREGFTSELWRSIKAIYDDILAHPFLRGLTDGTLPEERFRFYVLHTAVFKAYLEQVLLPHLRPGRIVVMDNLSAHKSERVKS